MYLPRFAANGALTLTDAERVAEVYSSHAYAYAACWSPIIRPIGQRLLDALPWNAVTRVLDIGTGTGALLPDIRARAPSALIVGVDRSQGMLALAAEHGVPLVVMDVAELAIRREAIDIAVMAFVLFHLGDPVAALMQASHVLTRAGSIGIVTWAEDPQTRAAEVWDEVLTAHGAIDPTPLSFPSDEMMDSPEKVRALIIGAGLQPVIAWIEPVEHQWNLDRFITLRTTYGTSKRKLQSLDEPTRGRALQRARARVSELKPEDFVYRGAAVCGIGRKP